MQDNICYWILVKKNMRNLDTWNQGDEMIILFGTYRYMK
jgi:hypothetical protein